MRYLFKLRSTLPVAIVMTLLLPIGSQRAWPQSDASSAASGFVPRVKVGSRETSLETSVWDLSLAMRDARWFSGDKPMWAEHCGVLDCRGSALAGETSQGMQPRVTMPSAHLSDLAIPQSYRRPWSLGVTGTTVFRDRDRATLTAYLPMKSHRAVEKIAADIFDSPEAGSWVSDAQALSLIARLRINTEFTYSTRFSKNSGLDASAIYRLNANPATGGSAWVMGLYYKSVF